MADYSKYRRRIKYANITNKYHLTHHFPPHLRPCPFTLAIPIKKRKRGKFPNWAFLTLQTFFLKSKVVHVINEGWRTAFFKPDSACHRFFSGCWSYFDHFYKASPWRQQPAKSPYPFRHDHHQREIAHIFTAEWSWFNLENFAVSYC